MKSTLILLLTAFIFTHSFSQNFELKKDKGAFGIYDATSKKWKTPAIYSALTEFSYKEAGAKIVTCYLATNKKGQLLISNDGITKLTEEHQRIYEIYGSKDYFILNDNSILSFYKLGEGILKSFGTFNGYFNEGYGSNLLHLTKGNKYSFFLPPNQLYPSFDFDDKVESNWNYIIGKKNGKYGLLNTEGGTIAEFQFDSLIGGKTTNYSFIFAKKKNKWGLLNDSGDEMIPCEYDDMDANFGRWYWRNSEKSPEFISVKVNGKWGTIDLQKNILLKPEYDSLLNVSWQQEITFLKNGKRGLTNFNGKLLFPANYTHFQKLERDLGVYLGPHLYLINNECTKCNVYSAEDGKWGLADSSGKVIAEPNANIVPLFNYKYSEAKATEFVNGTQEEELLFYQRADSFNIGFLWNIGGTKKERIISVSDSVLEDQVDQDGNFISVMREGTKEYGYNIIGGKTGVISPTGKIIIPIEYEDFSFLFHYKTEVWLMPKSLHEKNDVYLSEYKLAGLFNYFAKKNGKWGYYSWPNKQIIEPIYDSLEFFYNNYDLNDSTYTALGYHRRLLKAYDGKIIYYYADNGKLLYKQLPNEKICSTISLKKSDITYIYPFNDEYYVVAIDAKPKAFESSRIEVIEKFDEMGNTYIVEEKVKEQLITSAGGRFNLLHQGTFKFLFPEPVQDIYFPGTYLSTGVDSYSRFSSPLKWSDINTRMLLQFRNANFKEIPLDSVLPINKNNLPHSGIFADYFYFTQNNKRYIQKTNDTEPLNKNNGFDSIEVSGTSSYKAFSNGKFGMFSTDFKGPFVFETELRFPDYEGDYNIVCKDANYRFKTIYQEREEQIINEYGEILDSKWQVDTLKIPFVEKGKFNITDSSNRLVLNQWYDEILFPRHDGSGTFSIQDSSSFIYHPYKYMDSYYAGYIKRCNQSLAVRDGNVWKLIDLNYPQSSTIDGIQNIKAIDGSWIVTINGKKYRYSITNVFGGREDIEE